VSLIRDKVTWGSKFGDSPFFEGEVEPCINGSALALGARSSFHTTICVLEGLLEYEKANGAAPAVTAARVRAHEYLLDRSAGVEPDERMAEAVGLVTKRRHQNGRWPRNTPHPDPVHLDMEGGRGKPSRWNTLRASRVLRWYSARDDDAGSVPRGR